MGVLKKVTKGITGIFKEPKTPKPPPLPAPQIVPDVGAETGEEAMRRERRRSGFAKTMLTGALTPNSGGKYVLG